MIKKQSNPKTKKQTDPFESGSVWADVAMVVAVISLGLSFVFLWELFTSDGSNEREALSITGQLFMAGIQLLVISHLITILANIRWYTYKTSIKRSQDPIDASLFSGVIDEFKKISEQNKEQSEALKKSIEELSEKAEKTNTYLYHIYKK